MTDCTDPTPPTTALGSNQSGVRAHNERLVLTLIRQASALAKAEIARRTGLSPQTVSNIIGALEEDGLLLRGTPQRGRMRSATRSLTTDPAHTRAHSHTLI